MSTAVTTPVPESFSLARSRLVEPSAAGEVAGSPEERARSVVASASLSGAMVLTSTDDVRRVDFWKLDDVLVTHAFVQDPDASAVGAIASGTSGTLLLAELTGFASPVTSGSAVARSVPPQPDYDELVDDVAAGTFGAGASLVAVGWEGPGRARRGFVTLSCAGSTWWSPWVESSALELRLGNHLALACLWAQLLARPSPSPT